MSVEKWIDDISDLAGTVTDGKGTKVLAYKAFRKGNFPNALSIFPCAITYPLSAVMHYSDSGCWELWDGVTEFHLDGSAEKSHFPNLLLFYAKIRNAFALHRTLGGKVAYCQLKTDEASIQGPVMMQYGTENAHLGLIARWEVKEITSGDFTLGS